LDLSLPPLNPQKSEYKQFQNEKKETLSYVREAQSRFEPIQEDVFCIRGLEACLSSSAVQQKVVRKVAALQSVLETQYALRREGIVDPHKIREEYYEATSLARNQALERAVMDAREVKEHGRHAPPQEIQQEAQKVKATNKVACNEAESLRTQIDRIMQIKTLSVPQTSLRSATSGPLRLRKTVPTTA
jgi:hypothetical protein